ncbi:hypothetical protein NMY22_g3589 [Coprinellus aureogranulatus]|nr:hypothetical protein NMY22_g3589 [Coprinellus aureogranulatus]
MQEGGKERRTEGVRTDSALPQRLHYEGPKLLGLEATVRMRGWARARRHFARQLHPVPISDWDLEGGAVGVEGPGIEERDARSKAWLHDATTSLPNIPRSTGYRLGEASGRGSEEDDANESPNERLRIAKSTTSLPYMTSFREVSIGRRDGYRDGDERERARKGWCTPLKGRRERRVRHAKTTTSLPNIPASLAYCLWKVSRSVGTLTSGRGMRGGEVVDTIELVTNARAHPTKATTSLPNISLGYWVFDDGVVWEVRRDRGLGSSEDCCLVEATTSLPNTLKGCKVLDSEDGVGTCDGGWDDVPSELWVMLVNLPGWGSSKDVRTNSRPRKRSPLLETRCAARALFLWRRPFVHHLEMNPSPAQIFPYRSGDRAHPRTKDDRPYLRGPQDRHRQRKVGRRFASGIEKHAHIVQKLGSDAMFTEFKIQNIHRTCDDVKIPFRCNERSVVGPLRHTSQREDLRGEWCAAFHAIEDGA